MEGKAALPRRVKGELLFDPFCGVRPPENGLMAKGVLLLRLTALRELHGCGSFGTSRGHAERGNEKSAVDQGSH
jgi:hypothetical protein